MRVLTSALILTTWGCGASHDSQPSGYYHDYAARWEQRRLSVCWETTSSSFQDLSHYQSVVREVVSSEYARADFLFIGWKACNEMDPANVRVWVDPMVWPRVLAFGRSLDNWEQGLQLTFDFLGAGKGWGRLCQEAERRDNCIRNYALHEFGHALGLKHEADRADSACEQKTGSPGIEIGAYDPLSIMNYCNNEAEVRANRSPQLSANDVATLHQVYQAVVPPPAQGAEVWHLGQDPRGF